MPNWCFNRVICNGMVNEIGNLIDHVQENDNMFSFNAVIPMPKELQEIASPIKAFKTKAEVEDYNSKLPQNGDFIGKAITHAKHKALLTKYGYADWYSWSIANWGCKWNTSSAEISMQDNRNDGSVSYAFDTPWGPPEEIYHALVKLFPDVRISWFYEEPGMELSGYLPD